MSRRPKKHLVLHPVEEPVALLEMVHVARWNIGPRLQGFTIPARMMKCCRIGSVRVAAATPTNVPCFIRSWIERDRVIFYMEGSGILPDAVSFHLVGKARNTPPEWERHSRQQYTSNRRAFKKALP